MNVTQENLDFFMNNLRQMNHASELNYLDLGLNNYDIIYILNMKLFHLNRNHII